MKSIIILLTFLVASTASKSQQFLWSQSYEIQNCNEVAALAVDSNGNLFMCGVYNASPFVPYTGNCYLQKTNSEGIVMWTNYFTGTLSIGDMVSIDGGVVIIGQSNGPFTYEEEQYGSAGPYMFIIKVDDNGNHDWHMTDDLKYGVYTNLSAGENGNVAVHIRGQFNLGDWIYIMDVAGNILNTKLLSSTTTLVKDIAYFDGRVYINGGFNAPNSITIDTVFLPLPPIENATFVLALNQDLIAQWGVVDTTINNNDGRIVANSGGVFSYGSVIQPPFIIKNVIKKFTFDGELLAEVGAATFSTSIALYPDMTITPTRMAMFAQNSFDFNSHEIMVYDHDLNLQYEKEINGPSDLYSGQIASLGEDIFVAHVFSGDLTLDDELILPYSGSGKKPYLAKSGVESTTGLSGTGQNGSGFLVYPNPSNDKIYVSFPGVNNHLVRLMILNNNGQTVWGKSGPVNTTSINISQLTSGLYFIQAFFSDGTSLQEKLLVR